MVVYVSKNITEVRPIFFPDKHLVVIAYTNVVEVHNIEHNIIWKIEEKSKVVKLEIVDDDQSRVMHIKSELNNVFICNEDVVTIEINGINIYTKFDITKKRQISSIVFEHVSLSKKTGIIAMVENKKLLVMSITNDKTITHIMPNHRKSTNFTAVACSPTDSMVATADSRGKIELWWDVFNHIKKTTLLHWHFLSLPTLAFTGDGAHLLSGGQEQVVVKWQLSVTDSEKKKSFLPHLESHITSVEPFCGDSGEHYLVTLADNSYRVISSSLCIISTYAGLVQRSATLYNKLPRWCRLNPTGVKSCYNFPGQLSSTVMLNGHEGKMQFFDLVKQKTVLQLDVACQNWPTETENNRLPGFIQVQAVTVSSCGRRIATYESLGVGMNNIDNQRTMRTFNWNDEIEKFELESEHPLDWLEKVTDMVFQPMKADNLILITNNLRIVMFTRHVEHQVVSWTVTNIFELDEVLHRFKIEIKDCRRDPILATVGGSENDLDGALLITKGDCVIMYSWRNLITFNTKPEFAVSTVTLSEDLEIGDDNKEYLLGPITSSAIFKHPTTLGCYRIVLGLTLGLIVAETNLNPDWSVELKTVTSAVSKLPVKSLAACAGNRDFEARVAVLFERSDHLTILTIWNDEVSNTKTVTVPELECATWVPVEEQKKWILVGLKTDHNLRSIVFCDDEAAQYFKNGDVVKKEEVMPTNLLLSMLKKEDEINKPKSRKRKICERLDRSFMQYDAKSAPSAFMILSSLFA